MSCLLLVPSTDLNLAKIKFGDVLMICQTAKLKSLPNFPVSFVGGELSFLKLGSVLVGFEWRCVKYFLKASTAKITVLRSNVFWPVEWN